MATFNKARVARWLAGWPGSSKYFGPPRGYVDSIADLAEVECRVVARLKPARRVEHGLPELEGYPELEAEIRQRFLEIEESPQNSYILQNARILGENYFHPLITNRDRFVLDQAAYELEQGRHPAHYAVKLPRLQKVPGTTFSLVSRWSSNYWHWLFDCLGKLLLILENKPDGMPSITGYAALNITGQVFKRQSLEALGIRQEQLVDVRSGSHFQFENLWVADLPSAILYPEMDVIKVLRNAFLSRKTVEARPKRIYISRGKSGSRRPSNEEELERILFYFGFEKVCLEDLEFLQQVNLFKNATAIFSQHGAGLTNLVFASPGTKVFELFEPEFVNPCYAILANKMKLNYKAIFNVFEGFKDQPKVAFYMVGAPKKTKINCMIVQKVLTQNL
jgi:hypothetical protein